MVVCFFLVPFAQWEAEETPSRLCDTYPRVFVVREVIQEVFSPVAPFGKLAGAFRVELTPANQVSPRSGATFATCCASWALLR